MIARSSRDRRRRRFWEALDSHSTRRRQCTEGSNENINNFSMKKDKINFLLFSVVASRNGTLELTHCYAAVVFLLMIIILSVFCICPRNIYIFIQFNFLIRLDVTDTDSRSFSLLLTLPWSLFFLRL